MSEEERDKLIEEQIGTIERLERQLEWYDRTLEEKQKEITKRDKIIKEVREYINDNVMVYAFNDKKFPHWDFNDDNINDILEILDKVGDEK